MRGYKWGARQDLMTIENKQDLRIGEFLIEAQIISSHDLHDAINIAKLTSLPVGRILVMSNYVVEETFKQAVEAQSMVRDGVLPFKLAIEALSMATRMDVSLEEALTSLGWSKEQKVKKKNRLGELLLEAEIITASQLEMAISMNQTTGLPLGRVLVSLGALSDELLATALHAQTLIREGRITREQAMNGLVSAYQRRLPIELMLAEQGFHHGPNRPSVRLGELLLKAGIVEERAVLTALELSLLNEQPLGQALVESNELTGPLLDTSLCLQEMVGNRTLSIGQAAEALRAIRDSGESTDEVLAKLSVPQSDFKAKIRYHELLLVSGLIGHSNIELSNIPATEPGSHDALVTARTFRSNGFIDERIFHGSLRCYFLLGTGWLNIQQAIVALNYFHKQERVSFDDVLLELRWTIKTHIRTELAT